MINKKNRRRPETVLLDNAGNPEQRGKTQSPPVEDFLVVDRSFFTTADFVPYMEMAEEECHAGSHQRVKCAQEG